MSQEQADTPPEVVRCEQCGNIIPFRAGRCQFCGFQRAAYLPRITTSALDKDLPRSTKALGIWLVGLWFVLPACVGLLKHLTRGPMSLDPMAIIIYGATLCVFGARLAGGVGLLMRERWGHSLVFSIAILDLVLSALGLFLVSFTEVAAAALVLKPLVALEALFQFLVAALGVGINLAILWFLDKVDREMVGSLD